MDNHLIYQNRNNGMVRITAVDGYSIAQKPLGRIFSEVVCKQNKVRQYYAIPK